MRGVRRLLLVAGLGALALGVAGVVALPRLLARELEPARVSARLSEALGMDVAVEAVQLAWLPRPHVEASGVEVDGAARAATVEVGLEWRTILERQLAPSSIRLVEPELPVIRDADGRVRLGVGAGAGGAGLPPALRTLEIRDGRVALRDESVDPPLDALLLVDHLEVRRSWSRDTIRFEARLGLGEGRAGGHASVEGSYEPGASRVRARVEAGALDVAALRGHLPASWDVRAASGRLDARADVERTPGALRADLDLTLPEADLDCRGLQLGGASRLRGTLRRDPDAGLRIEDATASLASLRADGYRATGLEAAFGYAEGGLDVKTLRLATVTPGLGAAAALELPGADAVAVELRVVEAGELTLRGRLQLPGPGESGRQLSLPDLRARGTRLALVHDAAGDETTTEIRLDRLDWSHHVVGEVGTLKVEGAILGETPGRLRGSGRVGPLVAGRPLREHPFRGELELEDAPAAAFLPFVPESWPTPREDLGRLDAHVDAHREGDELTAHFEIHSQVGDGAAEVEGTLRQRPDPAPGAWPLDLEVTLRDLDLALLEGGLGEAGPIGAKGTVDATASLVARPGGALDGTVRGVLSDGSLDFGAFALGGAIHLAGHLARHDAVVGLSGATLTAERVTIRGYEGSDLRVRGDLAPPGLRIDEAVASFFEGTVRADGRVSLDGPTELDGHVRLHDLNLTRVLGHPGGAAEAEPIRIDGTLSLAGRLGDEDPNWIAPLRGEGVIELHGGELTGMPIRRAVAQALLALIPGAGLMLQVYSPPAAKLHEAAVPYRFEGGVIRIEGMRFVSSDYTVNAHGHVDHELAYRLDGDAALTSEGLANTLAWLSAPRIMQQTVRLPSFPIRIRGQLGVAEDADVGVDLSAVPMATARGLLGLGGRLGSKLVSPLRGLGDPEPPPAAVP